MMIDESYKKTIKKIIHRESSWLYKDIIIYDRVDSTNRIAKDKVKNGADEGTIILALTQDKGRGRYNRVWESPLGGLYLSIILRPNIPVNKAHLLSLTTSIATADTVKKYKLSPSIVWPNDIYIDNRKIAGILSESEVTGEELKYVVIGIGLNVNTRLDDYSDGLKPYVTSLLNEIGRETDIREVLENLLYYFDYYYKILLNDNVNYILDKWRGYASMLGRNIIIQTSSERITGRATDIDHNGFLHVITEDGEERIINSGDCIRLERITPPPT
ncbi:MAG: biotin--[acetyl-CoA-carboxylase] ligase [Candidatus Thermoplasmatota archaeon]